MYQRVTIAGYLGRDPEMRYTPDGKPVTNFSMATTDRWKNAAGESQERTVWWRVTGWGHLAEIMNQYLAKGSLVLVEGTIKADESGNPTIWHTAEGEARSSYELTASILRILSRKEAAADREERDDKEDGVPF